MFKTYGGMIGNKKQNLQFCYLFIGPISCDSSENKLFFFGRKHYSCSHMAVLNTERLAYALFDITQRLSKVDPKRQGNQKQSRQHI